MYRHPNPTTGATVVPAQAAFAFERLVLTGFMGSGKTTIGRRLADHLGWEFLDLDTAIERLGGRSVPDIFDELGEPEFRRLETAALTAALGSSRLVLALGGGAPESPANRQLLAGTPATAVVYLTAPFATLIERCHSQAEEPGATARPVLADRALAEQRFLRRASLYAGLATHTVLTDGRSPDQTLECVLGALGLP